MLNSFGFKSCLGPFSTLLRYKPIDAQNYSAINYQQMLPTSLCGQPIFFNLFNLAENKLSEAKIRAGAIKNV